MKKIAIVLLNYNHIEETKACLTSIEQTGYPHLKVILVDNASKEPHREEVLQQFPWVQWIQSEENLGYSGGNNLGIKKALELEVDGIMILNNDTTLPPHFFDNFLKELKPKTLYGGVPVQMDQQTHIDHLGGVWDVRSGRFRLIAANTPLSQLTSIPRVDYIAGSLILAPKEFFQTVGLFDPLYFLFWEEADLCHRAVAAGYHLAIQKEAIYAHHKSASIENPSKLKPYYWWRNRLYYIEKNLTAQEKLALFPRLAFEVLKLFVGRCALKSSKVSPSWGVLDFFKRSMGKSQRAL